jgi:hypothetical protein
VHVSENIIRVMKSRKIRWVEHVARTGDMRNAYKILIGNPGGKKRLGRRSRR